MVDIITEDDNYEFAAIIMNPSEVLSVRLNHRISSSTCLQYCCISYIVNKHDLDACLVFKRKNLRLFFSIHLELN